MPIRGPFVMVRRSWFMLRQQWIYDVIGWKMRFPGAYCQHNRKPKPKPKKRHKRHRMFR